MEVKNSTKYCAYFREIPTFHVVTIDIDGMKIVYKFHRIESGLTNQNMHWNTIDNGKVYAINWYKILVSNCSRPRIVHKSDWRLTVIVMYLKMFWNLLHLIRILSLSSSFLQQNVYVDKSAGRCINQNEGCGGNANRHDRKLQL